MSVKYKKRKKPPWKRSPAPAKPRETLNDPTFTSGARRFFGMKNIIQTDLTEEQSLYLGDRKK